MIQLLRWFALSIWLFWLLVYWRGGPGLVSGLWRAFRSSIFHYDGFLITGIILSSVVLLWSGILITTEKIEGIVHPFIYPITILGFIFIIAGAVGTMICRKQLGKFWNVKAELFENHQVIDKGLYRIVRHPIYALASLKTVGTVLLFTTWWNILAGLLAIAFYTAKALSEEKLLTTGLPGYQEYKRRVPYRMAPWIW